MSRLPSSINLPLRQNICFAVLLRSYLRLAIITMNWMGGTSIHWAIFIAIFSHRNRHEDWKVYTGCCLA